MFRHILVASVSAQVAGHGPIPVLIVREGDAGTAA